MNLKIVLNKEPKQCKSKRIYYHIQAWARIYHSISTTT